MGAVKVGQIKYPNTALIGAFDEGVEFFLTHARLVGLPVPTFDAGTHAYSSELELGPAERHVFIRIEASPFGFGGRGELCADEHSTHTEGRLFEELATFDFHKQQG